MGHQRNRFTTHWTERDMMIVRRCRPGRESTLLNARCLQVPANVQVHALQAVKRILPLGKELNSLMSDLHTLTGNASGPRSKPSVTNVPSLPDRSCSRNLRLKSKERPDEYSCVQD